MSNETLDITLNAKNSSGEQKLHLSVQDINGPDEYSFTLTGEYEGKPIQIDFDETNREDLVEMKEMLELILSV